MAKVVKLEKRSEKLLKILMFLLLAVLILSVAVVFFKKKYRIDPKTDVSVTIIGMSNRYTE